MTPSLASGEGGGEGLSSAQQVRSGGQDTLTQPHPHAGERDGGRTSYLAAFAGQYRWTTITAMAGVVLGSLDTYIVNTGMPRVLAELGDPVLYAGVASAFILAQIVGLSIGGAWRDGSGLRTPFLVSVTLFGLGSLSCAFAPTMPALVAARAFQGLGGGGILALCMAAVAAYPGMLRLRDRKS